jgi:hypothetical protein
MKNFALAILPWIAIYPTVGSPGSTADAYASSIQSVWRQNAGQTLSYAFTQVTDRSQRTRELEDGPRAEITFPEAGDTGLIRVKIIRDGHFPFDREFTAPRPRRRIREGVQEFSRWGAF